MRFEKVNVDRMLCPGSPYPTRGLKPKESVCYAARLATDENA